MLRLVEQTADKDTGRGEEIERGSQKDTSSDFSNQSRKCFLANTQRATEVINCQFARGAIVLFFLIKKWPEKKSESMYVMAQRCCPELDFFFTRQKLKGK